MELTYEDNTQSAAAPQAIQTSPPQKLPIWDNDPTRNVSQAQGARRYFVMTLGVVALLAMALATVAVFLRG